MTFEATSAGQATNRNRDQTGSLLADSLNSLNDGFLVFDSGMNYVFANVAGARMLGYTPSSLVGKNFNTAHPEWNNTIFEKSCRLVLLNEQSIFTDVRLAKDQPAIFLRIYFSPARHYSPDAEICQRNTKRAPVSRKNHLTAGYAP